MSVILDALHKARTDRRKNQSESNPNSVARVLEPVVAMPEAPARSEKRGGGGWMLALTILLVFVCLLVLAGGAFFLLYDQMRRLEPVATAQQPVQPPVANNGVAMPAVPAAALATPLPLSELPVQTPSPVSAPAAVVAVAPTAAVNPADNFKLGSIVCEANDCIAHLNGRSVRVGDRLKNYQVIEITPTDLTLQGPAPNDVITLSHYD